MAALAGQPPTVLTAAPADDLQEVVKQIQTFEADEALAERMQLEFEFDKATSTVNALRTEEQARKIAERERLGPISDNSGNNKGGVGKALLPKSASSKKLSQA